MKCYQIISQLLIVVVVLLGTPVTLQADDLFAETEYTPPEDVGKPSRRVGAGTRSQGPRLSLNALAPTHTGWSTGAQPTLYWSISEAPINVLVRLINTELSPLDDNRMLLKEAITVEEPGIQALALADYDIQLQPETIYEWSVSIVGMPRVSALATIKFVSPESTLQQAISETEARQLPVIYAKNSYWYDAIDSVSKLIADNPQKENYKLMRMALLRQVNLADDVIQVDKPKSID